MAWETRGGARYYYRAGRQDGRVVKTYLGRGDGASEAAAEDAKALAADLADRMAARALDDGLALLDQATHAMDEQVDLLVEAVLVAAGNYRHHGEWRRRGRDTTAPTPRGTRTDG